MPRERGSRSRRTASPSRAKAISIDSGLPAESVVAPYAWLPAGKAAPGTRGERAPARSAANCSAWTIARSTTWPAAALSAKLALDANLSR